MTEVVVPECAGYVQTYIYPGQVVSQAEALIAILTLGDAGNGHVCLVRRRKYYGLQTPQCEDRDAP